MPRSIFVNLPVADLERSIRFYSGIGATRNPRFSDQTAACMVVSDTIYVMILTHAKYREFTARPIADPKSASAFLLALSCDSREAVDEIVGRAAAAGGAPDPNPRQDHGFMFSRSFEDPDGHVWEPFWMDPAVAAGESEPA